VFDPFLLIETRAGGSSRQKLTDHPKTRPRFIVASPNVFWFFLFRGLFNDAFIIEIMNWKGFGGKLSWRNRGIIPAFA
jgi:hypothetical protein